MIPLNNYLNVVREAIPRFAQHPPNPQQTACIESDPATPLMIVAGPGTGKTTVLVLRALRLVFVEGLYPEQIALTTFTNKAADELRARLIEWGLGLLEHLQARVADGVRSGDNDWLDSIDINRFETGTLDSIAEQLLTTHRDPTNPAPVLLEGFVGDGILARNALFPTGAHRNPDLDAYLALFTLDGSPPMSFGDKLLICRTLVDRFVHDLVNPQSFCRAQPHQAARNSLWEALRNYKQFMHERYCMDFALLEETFLQRLNEGRLHRFTENVRALLVDEYQDTNPLQEQIYMSIVQQARASFTIVGDDDQSLYRFRGATVELFRDFETRFSQAIPEYPPSSREYLIDNYRSTPEIVTFLNDFVTNDPNFQAARVQGKPRVLHRLPSEGVPVLGMFRPTVGVLAADLAQLIYDVFRGTDHTIRTNDQEVLIRRNDEGGDFGDSVLLSHTVNEYGARFGANPPRARLPLLLRQELARRSVQVYNPRGQHLRDIRSVQELLGLVLECIDPLGAIEGRLWIRNEARQYLAQWRQAARSFYRTDPRPNSPHSLSEFVHAWQRHTPQTVAEWPSEWPVLELCFKLVTWFPIFQDDPEGQVWLEGITRCIAQAATFSPYRSMILWREGMHSENSVRSAIRDILVPIAESSVEIDEDIMPHIPRSRFPIMTIHQAKGLEFPLVIVDVASDYTRNHPRNRFRRFPDHPSSVQIMEDDLGAHCEIGPPRQTRSAHDRSFDDLVRLYYVAYSRPQSALILVGLNTVLRYSTTIAHVATWWRSDETWAWTTPTEGRPPGLANNIPLVLI